MLVLDACINVSVGFFLGCGKYNVCAEESLLPALC